MFAILHAQMDKDGERWRKMDKMLNFRKEKGPLRRGTSWTWHVLRSRSCWWFGPGGAQHGEGTKIRKMQDVLRARKTSGNCFILLILLGC